MIDDIRREKAKKIIDQRRVETKNQRVLVNEPGTYHIKCVARKIKTECVKG